jgi:hypothetical protein
MYFYKLYSFNFLLIFRLQDLYTRIPLYKNRFFSLNSILISRFYCTLFTEGDEVSIDRTLFTIDILIKHI